MTEPAEPPQPLLEARGVVKTFPGVRALDQVDFDVAAGEVHGLIGENGAGKSTLMHILAGAQQPDGGEILLDGRPVAFSNPREALELGISIVYQELNLIPHLTVAENIFLGRELRTAIGLIDAAEQNRRSADLLAQLDPSIDPTAEVHGLRVGQQQIVEIAKALNAQARVIFMDEPTSAVSDQEVEVLFRLIEKLTAEGIAIVYVSHKLDELMQISNRITVLRDGCLVETVATSETNKQAIVQLMVGRELSELFTHSAARRQGEVLRVERLSLASSESDRPRLDNISFTAAGGEVLGVFGLMGAGRTELLESIFGLHPRETTGTIHIAGGPRKIRTPADAMHHGIGLVPEDRKLQGLVLQLNVLQNITLSSLAKLEHGLFLSGQEERRQAAEFVDALSIKTPSVAQNVRNLSGGNQQKVVLAKVLSTEPRVLLLDEPTRGIDVRAKHEIYRLIDQLKARGLAIVVVSSELPEILGIADRMMVLCEGRKTLEIDRAEATEERLLAAAVPGVHAVA